MIPLRGLKVQDMGHMAGGGFGRYQVVLIGQSITGYTDTDIKAKRSSPQVKPYLSNRTHW